jgi:hypothetical protein
VAPQDFAYLGYYDINNILGLNTPFVQGLTHRYVNGDLRLLTYHRNGKLYEVSLAGKNYGSKIQTTTNFWALSEGLWDFVGLWWNESQSLLWTVTAVDYTITNYPVQLFTRRLNSDGTASNTHGPVGLQGVPAKRVHGGVQPVPAWFQVQYDVGPYVAGWGGYTSLVMQGGGASMGPTMYSIPDPSSYANHTEVPASAFKTIMDSFGAPATDWYSNGTPSSFDRGSRLTLPINYFDGGDTRPNGTCPTCNASTPSLPLAAGAQWLSPSPDGYGRWVWGDSNYNTGMWIDTPTRKGFVTVASLGGGKTWYCASTLCYESRKFEMHIFDPAHLGEAARGQRPVWNVKPTYMQELTLPGLGGTTKGNGSLLNVSGATFDSTTKRMYLLAPGVNTYDIRIYVFQLY